MGVFLNYELRGFRDSLGRFAKRTELLVTRRREAARRAGTIALGAIKREAPWRTGIFKRGLIYRTYDRGQRSFVRIYATGEHAFLLDIIRYGSRPHKIPKGGSAEQLAKGYPLRFWWEKGPHGPGVYRFWSVNHPGTKPNPFIERGLAQVEDDILDELRAVAASVARLS